MNNISETKLRIFARDNWTCQVCGKMLIDGIPQLAHRINQSKMYLKKYGKEIIHHDLNMISVCSLKCNIAVSIYGKDKLIDDLVKKIKKILDKNDNIC
jgi:hypothetical protein